MFKIQNATPGNLPLDLENGSITLTNGQKIDLDVYCSRKWIRTDPTFNRLRSVGAVALIHDSEEVLPTAPIKQINRVEPSVARKPIVQKPARATPEMPVVLDLSDQPDELAPQKDMGDVAEATPEVAKKKKKKVVKAVSSDAPKTKKKKKKKKKKVVEADLPEEPKTKKKKKKKKKKKVVEADLPEENDAKKEKPDYAGFSSHLGDKYSRKYNSDD